MVGAGPRHTCRGLFRKVNILPIPCVYICALIMFVINNLEKFQTSSSVHEINLFTPRLNPLAQDRQPMFFSGHLISNACS
jgi:hypothetical protein